MPTSCGAISSLALAAHPPVQIKTMNDEMSDLKFEGFERLEMHVEALEEAVTEVLAG